MNNEKSHWQKFLERKKEREESLSNAKLSDLLDKDKYSKDSDLIDSRILICMSCDHFIKITKQCSKCGCFMKLKTRLTDANCPIGKW